MSTDKRLLAFSGCVILAASTLVSAHTTVVKKNTPSDYAARVEMEGSGGVINEFSIPHGCAAPESDEVRPVRAMSVVFPNDATAVAVRTDTEEAVVLADEIIGNAIMSPKPIQDSRVFRRTKVRKGPVPVYNNHGEKDTDNRSIYLYRGYLDVDMVGIVPFRASFPKFKAESCATSLKIDFAIANYCTRSMSNDNRADIWIGRTTEKFNDVDVIDEGFWPSMIVMRNLEKNPMAESCGEGYQVRVTPSDQSIDALLPMRGYWPAGR